MNFSNFLNLFAAILSAIVAAQYWVLEKNIIILDIPITWQETSTLMLVLYWVSISCLAKDLQINEIYNSVSYSYKMSYINSHGEEIFIVENQPEIYIEKETT